MAHNAYVNLCIFAFFIYFILCFSPIKIYFSNSSGMVEVCERVDFNKVWE